MQEGGTEQTGLSRYGLLHGGLFGFSTADTARSIGAADEKKQMKLLLSSAGFGSGDFAR